MLTREMLLSSYRNSSMLPADKGNATVILSKQQYAARWQGKCYCHPIETAVCCPLTREMLLSSYRNSSMLPADKGNATVILSKQQYAARWQGKCYCHPIETAVCCSLTREMLLSSYRNSSMLPAVKGNATVILSKQQYAARWQGKCYCHPIETAVWTQNPRTSELTCIQETW